MRLMSRRLRLPKVEPTPEAVYFSRRAFVKTVGLGAVAAATGVDLLGRDALAAPPADANLLRPGVARPEFLKLFPAQRNATFNFDPPLTDAAVAAGHNNFYEFTTDKAEVWKLAQSFEPDPWSIEVTGLCHKPATFDIDAIMKIAAVEQEERTYHFRCVEAWAMDVPWTGFALGQLLSRVEPKSDAKFVRFVSVNRPQQMPGIKSQSWYPWPYFEGLRMDEAMNDLTLFCTGIYGRPLPRQHGAPFRVIVPWKYGYKNPKSIVKIELVEKQPATFWQTLAPTEYPFESNVNPDVPHPRWSQAKEHLIGTGEPRPTRIYNGYGAYVAGLYT